MKFKSNLGLLPFLLLAGCSTQQATTLSSNTIASAPVQSTPTPIADQTVPDWARGTVITQVPVDPHDKVFALTFDDGPWPKSTRRMLQVLDECNVKATFFMVGQELSRRPEIAREVLAAGHAIGNHSWDHPSRPKDPVGQVQRTDALLEKTLGFPVTLFRPPYGLLKNGLAAQAKKENEAIILWSASASDWSRPGAGSIASMTIAQAQPGGIALLHDGGGDRSQTIEAVPRIVNELRAKGYRFVTIPELLKLRVPGAPLPAVDQKLMAKINH